MSRLVPLSLVLMLSACSGKRADEAPAKAEAAPAAGAAPAAAKAEPAATPAPAPAPAPAQTADLGNELRDPAWFNPGIWPGSTVTKSGRSETDAAGLFSSQILLDLPPGITAEQCANTLVEKIKSDVPGFAINPDEKAPAGRVTARGETDYYRATLVCGEAKGVMKAYLGYAWTKRPPA